jgi:hypothetical protein
MKYKIVDIPEAGGSVIVFYTVIGGKVRVAEVSERVSVSKIASMEKIGVSLDELAKSRAAILEAAHITVGAPTT